MKNLQQWFNEYAESHQNTTNQAIHYICVPAIYFSIVGILMSIPTHVLENILPFKNPILENWAFVVMLPLMLFYFKLSLNTFRNMLLFSILCLMGNYYIAEHLPLLYTSIIIFIIAWIGQFYGHKLEGKKPSFFKDLQFLLIGPAWVFEKLGNKYK